MPAKKTSQYPDDMSQGLQLYAAFHQLDYKKIVQFPNLVIPAKAYHSGQATWTYYESKKWEGTTHGYKHEHESGVKIAWTDQSEDADKLINVPEFIRKTKTLVRLGAYIGGEYEDFDGDIIDVDVSKPYPDLFSIPDGTALLIIDAQGVVAIIWGGNLNVTARGIVG